MKSIEILYNNGKSFECVDDDDNNLDMYAKELSTLLDKFNITILHTTSSSIVIKPSEITSIKIKEIIEEKTPKINKDEELTPDKTIEIPIEIPIEEPDTLTEI